MTWLSCVAQGLHLQRLCIASDRVGRESATATAKTTAKKSLALVAETKREKKKSIVPLKA